MSTVHEIKSAIEQLPPKDLTQLSRWILDRENQKWDLQMDEDSAAGKLDFLFEEAEAEGKSGKLQDWPPTS